MSREQSKSLLQQISQDHYEQAEPQAASTSSEAKREEKLDTPSCKTRKDSEGDQTDSSLSPTGPFISAIQSPCSSLPPSQLSPTPSVSEWQDAHSDIYSDNQTIDDVDGDLASKYPLDTFGVIKRRLSRGQSGSQRSHHSRGESDLADIEFPSLDLFYGPHLKFHPEEDGETPDENDLFPSTPLDEDQLQHADSKLKEELGGVVINTIEDNEDLQWSDIGWLDPRWLDPRPLMNNAAENAEVFAMNVWHKFQSWKVVGFSTLPQFLQENDFLKKGHRPPLPNFKECFKSIFRIHTETGNIWTHLLGVVAFIGVALFFMTRPTTEIDHQEKAVFMAFFSGAIVCMGLSFTYHTVCCHQNRFIGQLFVKFDYCGIAFLTVGSFVPWLYYSFYCTFTPKVVYMTIVSILGLLAVIVSLWDKFGTPRYRPYRAAVFIVFGLSGIAPATHYAVQNGWEKSINEAAMGWLVFMGFLYITGALMYAFRIPERFFPGKVDILFHSHQLFHCFVIAGAFVHYHGISNMALYRLQIGECPLPAVELSQFA
eukprot:GFUD01088382.1.p1 GENE.GFUD01088382.1~~GFUD01088382.1.p1  ORF type:complete len:540 (+),score=161.29 GFUD01088382.1:69-1688(+)